VDIINITEVVSHIPGTVLHNFLLCNTAIIGIIWRRPRSNILL